MYVKFLISSFFFIVCVHKKFTIFNVDQNTKNTQLKSLPLNPHTANKSKIAHRPGTIYNKPSLIDNHLL